MWSCISHTTKYIHNFTGLIVFEIILHRENTGKNLLTHSPGSLGSGSIGTS